VPAAPRDRETRTADTLTMLATPAIDVWVATSSDAGAPHLVPLSLAWTDERVVAGDEALRAAFVAQADWDPRNGPGYVFLVLRPVRVQAWRESNEIAGRTLMRDGVWLTERMEPADRMETR
jgi:hypothetical protein